MKYVEFTQDSNIKFQNSETKKIEWYSSDTFKGEKFEIADIVYGGYKCICVKLIDGDYGLVNPNHIRVI